MADAAAFCNGQAPARSTRTVQFNAVTRFTRQNRIISDYVFAGKVIAGRRFVAFSATPESTSSVNVLPSNSEHLAFRDTPIL